ncbi:MAG: hypothetical protein OSJ65_08085 [Bacilli bacterium]|nr:hypothetical protein [Bacilli bacterium]
MYRYLQSFVKDNWKYLLCIFFLFFVTFFRIALISYLPFGVRITRPYDQVLMANMAKNIINTGWLGIYDDKILTKGIIYPFFLVGSHISRLPYYIFFTLFYIISVLVFLKSIYHLLGNKRTIILYLIFLFNPVSFSKTTFLEIYRNSLGMCTVLLFIAAFIFLYRNYQKRLSHLFSSMFLGFVIMLILYTREDGIWIYPTLILFLIVFFLKCRRLYVIRFFITIFLIFIPTLTFGSVIKMINYDHYGIYYINELKEGYYPKFFLDLLQIDGVKRKYHQVLTKESLEKAFEVSPTLGELKEDFEKEFFRYEDNFLTDYSMWSVRTFIYNKNHFTSGKDASKYFETVYKELENGFKSGYLKRDKRVLSIFFNRFNKGDFLRVLKQTLESIKFSVQYDGYSFYHINMYDEELGKLFNSKIEKDVASDDYNAFFNIFRSIHKIYKVIFPVVFIISLIKYICLLFNLVVRKRKSEVLFISSLVVLSYLSLIFGISYTKVATFDAISSYYFVPVYSLQVMFVGVLLFSNRRKV